MHEPAPSAEAEALDANSYERILRLMLAIPRLITPVLWIKYSRGIAMGFIAGCLIAVFNFYWLKRSVTFLADRVTSTGRKQSAARVVSGFLLRYFLIAAGAYGIFKGSATSVKGPFAGLFVPVGAFL